MCIEIVRSHSSREKAIDKINQINGVSKTQAIKFYDAVVKTLTTSQHIVPPQPPGRTHSVRPPTPSRVEALIKHIETRRPSRKNSTSSQKHLRNSLKKEKIIDNTTQNLPLRKVVKDQVKSKSLKKRQSSSKSTFDSNRYRSELAKQYPSFYRFLQKSIFKKP